MTENASSKFGDNTSKRNRAWSSGEDSMGRAADLRDRLRYTVDFQAKGFKPNTRGHSIQDSLVTLDDLLLEFPEEVGFNIEMSRLYIDGCLGGN